MVDSMAHFTRQFFYFSFYKPPHPSCLGVEGYGGDGGGQNHEVVCSAGENGKQWNDNNTYMSVLRGRPVIEWENSVLEYLRGIGEWQIERNDVWQEGGVSEWKEWCLEGRGNGRVKGMVLGRKREWHSEEWCLEGQNIWTDVEEILSHLLQGTPENR